jgi:hypothetical protein
MTGMQKIKLALAVAAVLAMGGTGWAKNGGIPGDLNSARNEVTVQVPVPSMTATTEGGLCDTANTAQTYDIKAYIFQPSGRMFAIGIGYSEGFNCSTSGDQQIDVLVKAFPGLTFKPGPATFVYQVIQTTTTAPTTPGGSSTVADLVVHEYGSKVNLH